MKRLFILTAVIMFLIVGSSAFAQEGDNGKGKRTPVEQPDRRERQGNGQGQQRSERGGQGGGGLFRLLDIDRDGKLSAKEIDGAVVVLMKLDVNKDGILDAQELAVTGGGGRGGQGRNQGRRDQQGAENSQRRDGGQGRTSNGKRTADK